MSLPRAYEDLQEPGALGGVQPFAKAHKLKTPQAQRILQSVLSYTLHKPPTDAVSHHAHVGL